METKLGPKDRSDRREQRKGEYFRHSKSKYGEPARGTSRQQTHHPRRAGEKGRQEERSLILMTLGEAVYNPHMPGSRGTRGAVVCITWHSVRDAYLEAAPQASGSLGGQGASSGGFTSPPGDLGECSSLGHTPDFMINLD